MGYFNKKVQFYTLFALILHIKYGLENASVDLTDIDLTNIDLTNINILKQVLLEIESKIERINDDVLEIEDYKRISIFINLHKTRTTNQKERKERILMLLNDVNIAYSI